MKIDQSWCPSCREWTVIDAGRPCAWCGEMLVKRRGGWRRPDIHGRINERMAYAIHAKYEQGISARKLGQALYATLGYRSSRTCEAAIGHAFHRYGLPVRGRIEATVLASTSSGLSPRNPRERRRRRREAGLVSSGVRAMQPRQPQCEGMRSKYPRKGERCSKPAAVGSRFCWAHDPARREEVARIVTAARERRAA